MLNRLVEEVNADAADVYGLDGCLLPVRKWPPRRLELLGKHIKVNAFADKVTVGPDSPLKELFKQIAGNVIRPASERVRLIEHDPAEPPQLEAPEDE